MKFAAKSLLLLIALAATFASAQTLPHFQHIIIVVQENRTPDNLFGSSPIEHLGCGFEDPFETGVDIENGGYAYVPQPNGPPQLQLICNTALPLSSWDANLRSPKIVDPDHSYNSPGPNSGWVADFDGGNLDDLTA